MKLLPRISAFGWTACNADAEYEGRAIEIYWLGFILEIAIGRRDRRYDG